MDQSPSPTISRPASRAKYAFVLVVLVTGVLMVVDMIFRINIGDAIFSWQAFALLYPIAYVIAPTIEKRLPFKRW